MKHKILPCPFCGYDEPPLTTKAEDCPRFKYHQCQKCNARTMWSRKHGYNAWNTRAPDARLQTLAKALQGMIKHVESNFKDTESVWVLEAKAALVEAGITKENNNNDDE